MRAQGLSGRIRVLAERYAVTLPVLEAEVEVLARKAMGHLGKMGFGV